MYAAASGRADCMRLLLEASANKEASNNVRLVNQNLSCVQA